MEDLTDHEEDQLRRALAIIGQEAGSAQAITAGPRHRAWWRRHPVAATWGGLAAAAVCIAMVTAGIGGNHADNLADESGAASNSLSRAEDIACSRIIAVGDVVAVRPAPKPGRLVVDFTVQDWIKPKRGKDRISINIVDPTTVDDKRWKPGDHLLIIIPRNRDHRAGSFRVRSSIRLYRDLYEHALPKAAQTRCPRTG